MENLSVGASHDEYQYDTDPRDLVRFLLRRFKRPVNAVFSLISFPERTDTVSLWWTPHERLTADLSYSRTLTVIDQELQSSSVSINYDVTDLISLGAGASYSQSDEVRRQNGNVLVDESDGMYYEFTLEVIY